jgi:hypothetical protein
MVSANVWIHFYMYGRSYQYVLYSLFYKHLVLCVNFEFQNSMLTTKTTIDFFHHSISFCSPRLFEPAQTIDLVKGLVVLGCAVPMCFMDISVVYHTVRAQAAIKLYMFFNMLEVSQNYNCDKNNRLK